MTRDEFEKELAIARENYRNKVTALIIEFKKSNP